MKYTLCEKPTVLIDDFANDYTLELVVIERDKPVGDNARYYAKFRGCEVAERGMLVNMFGDGSTPTDAICDYIQRISGKTLVTYHDGSRTNLTVPILRIGSLEPV